MLSTRLVLLLVVFVFLFFLLLLLVFFLHHFHRWSPRPSLLASLQVHGTTSMVAYLSDP